MQHLQAEETKPKVYVATEDHHSNKPYYELNAQVGEKFLLYGNTLIEGTLLKVASKRTRQVGYIPMELIHPLDEM